MITTPRPSLRRVPPLDAHERAMSETPQMAELQTDPHPSGWDAVLMLFLLLACLVSTGLAIWQIVASVLA